MSLFGNKKKEYMEAINHAVLINLCIKMGITPEEFDNLTSQESIDKASKFMIDVLSIQSAKNKLNK